MSSAGQGPGGLVGRAIGGYRLERMLGKGATGAVFLGQRLSETPQFIERTERLPVELPDEAAVKVLILPWQLEEDERADFRARFEREALTLQRLRHPHIVSLLDYGDDPAAGYTYMVLDYLPGGSLASYQLRLGKPAPLDETASYLSQVAAALDYAHGQGVIHRDIKPGNILLDGQGKAYLADFSIARIISETHTRLTSTGRVLGTPEYMAPEQIDGRDVGPAADLYGLGMVVYQLVTGRVAFSATSIMELIRLQTQADPTPPRILRPDLPEPAEAAILRALAKDPKERFGSAGTFAQAFTLGLTGGWAAGLAPLNALTPQPHASENEARTLPNAPVAETVIAARRRMSGARVGLLSALAVALVAAAIFGTGTALGYPLQQWRTLTGLGPPPTPTATPMPTATPIPFWVSGVSAVISPGSFDGACSSAMTFSSSATIHLIPGGPGGKLSYDWLNSDGQRSPVQTVEVAPGATSQAITGSLSLSAAMGTGATLSRTLEIITPNAARSNPANFRLVCHVRIQAVTLFTTPAHLACRQDTQFSSTVTVRVSPGPAQTYTYYWYGPLEAYYGSPNKTGTITISGGSTTASLTRTDMVSAQELGWPYSEYAISIIGHGEDLGNTTYTYMDSNIHC